MGDFRRFIGISHTVTGRFLRYLAFGEITQADKRINQIHVGSDPADIRSRIPDQILALVEFAVSECSSFRL